MHQDPGFGGQSLGRSAVAGVTLSESAYSPGARMQMHSHPNAYFCYVRRGSFREDWKRGSSEHHQEEVIFHPAGDEHANAFLDQSRCFNVELGSNSNGVAEDRRLIEWKPVRRILGQLYREFRNGADSPLVIEGLVYQALGEAFERVPAETRRSSPWLARVRVEIANRYVEPLTLAQLSASVGVHPVHLARAFRKEYGTSVGDHVRALRVSYAQQLLRNRSLNLSDIALQAGFADQSHFNRLFKRSTGLTPRQYRG